MFKKTKDFSSFSPVIVPISENETEEEFLQRWKKFDALPKDIKDKLSAKETLEEMKNIKQIFNLELPQIASISMLIRSYYFKEVKMENFASILSEEIKIDLSKAQKISKHITEKIINQKIRSENSAGAGNTTIARLPLLEALKKYPELGRQRISANDIKLKNFPDLVKPSIKNWIADFRQVMGTGNHGAIEKSNYLFHDENAKKLNPQELQKLSLVLKSLDSHIPLTINTKERRVIFPSFEAKEGAPRIKHYAASRKPETETSKATRLVAENDKPIKTSKRPNKNDAGNFRFSSPQTLESEKEEEKKLNKNKTEYLNYYQIYPMGIKNNNEEKKSRVKGNIVNLREDF